MVYIRVKKTGSDRYLYLVRSVWNPERGTSEQKIVKYLGKASGVSRDDIPPEYRDDPKILAALAASSPGGARKRGQAEARTRRAMYAELTAGNAQGCARIYDGYERAFGQPDFFERILGPVMHRIGDDWHSGRISIATEHVASNVAQSLVKTIMERRRASARGTGVLICVPAGEEHRLGCDVLEAYLAGRGYRVYNMTGPMPAESVCGFVADHDLGAVMVSITLEDNIRAGQRLVRRIREASDVPVLVGGYALRSGEEGARGFEGAEVLAGGGLAQVPRAIRRLEGGSAGGRGAGAR